MVCVWCAVVSLQTFKVAGKEDPLEDLGHGIGWVGSVADLEKLQNAAFGPFLGGEVLYVHVPCAAAGPMV
jgi:hypothetical protein